MVYRYSRARTEVVVSRRLLNLVPLFDHHRQQTTSPCIFIGTQHHRSSLDFILSSTNFIEILALSFMMALIFTIGDKLKVMTH